MRNYIIIVAIFLLTSCTNEKYEINDIYFVSTVEGISIRNEPNIDAFEIDRIPYLIRIKVIEITNKKDKINGVKAEWLKVKFYQKSQNHETVERIGYVLSNSIIDIKKSNVSRYSDLIGEYLIEDNLADYYLTLLPNNKFEIIVNLCAGLGKIKGNSSYDNNILILKENSREYGGFYPEEPFEIEIEVKSANQLMLIEGRSGWTCNDDNQRVLERIKINKNIINNQSEIEMDSRDTDEHTEKVYEKNGQPVLKFSALKSLLMGSSSYQMKQLLGEPDKEYSTVMIYDTYFYWYAALDDSDNEIRHIRVLFKKNRIENVISFKPGEAMQVAPAVLGGRTYVNSPK
ncbi:hypothetical protein [Lutimonas vermicola]|uniref:SH3 domain-containing protein n=1 Tax=Lutimonas vermicola TaxID=414288 RepID=A0ABU9L3C6_9FLAO